MTQVRNFYDIPCERSEENEEVYIKVKESDLLKYTGAQVSVITRKEFRLNLPAATPLETQ